MENILKAEGYPWPQCFDGQGGKLTRSFGVDGSRRFLVDKKGCLRFDNVRARDDVRPKGDTISFEDKISSLLAEP